jgi:hypothetical protein
MFGQPAHDSLILHYRKLSVQMPSDSMKYVYIDSLRAEVKQFMGKENSYNLGLDKVPYLGDLRSPDNAFRMITWNVTLKDGTYDYFCFVQMKPNSHDTSIWFELTDHHKETRRPEYKSLNQDNWYGSLYYSIIPFKKDKQMMYALLGWEGNSSYSNKKIIDCMYFNAKDKPMFGKSVFQTKRMNKRRVVFEYSKEAYLMLRYNEDMKAIIFNRLEPSKPDLKGIYSFYQPVMVYDAYQYKKGEWILLKDVNPRNTKSDKEFHNPKDLKKPKL